eukprot:TRINITY_DN6368_c0_g1_i1.p2 TRINITY_DN6368_c0_g1~~TRINITY_DN6368_c0_g1_i1.p2  ORF type:complete len:217 (+),score=48.96 TRINITY_DN6368_c0_g1_i1:81-731(+)
MEREIVMGPNMNTTVEPIVQFTEWYNSARDRPSRWIHNFALSTVDSTGQPHSRTVSMHTYDDEGFIFCTATEGNKAKQLAGNPKVSMLFVWELSRRQIRINGFVTKLPEEMDRRLYDRCSIREQLYFYTMGKGEEDVYNQSNILTEEQVDQRISDMDDDEIKFTAEGYVPFPTGWGGYNITPTTMEFLDLNTRGPARYRWRRDTVDSEWIYEQLAP